MKKFIVILAAVVIAATVWATNQVTSINVAGYVKATLDRGAYSMLRFDFFAMQGDATVSNVAGMQLPVGTKIFIWNGAGYNLEEYKTKLSATPPFVIVATNWVPGTNVLDPGVGFWIRVPGSAAQPTYVLNLMGEVPNNPTSNIPIQAAYNMVGYSYPTAIAWTNTTLAKNAKVGDKVFWWNGAGYDLSEYKTQLSATPPFVVVATNWSGIGISYVVQVGQGFWYKSASATNRIWSETRPYDLD